MSSDTPRSISTRIWALALPTVLYNLLEMTLGLVDLLMVRSFGPEATAAIGLIRQVTFIVEAAVASLVVGVVTLVSQGIGRKDLQQVSDTVHQSLYASVLLGAGLGALGYIFAREVMWIIQLSDAAAAHGLPYFRLYAASVVFLCVNNVSAAIMRGAQDATTPLKLATGMALLNIPLNYLFIHPLGYGVMGAAMGTLIARGCGTAAFVALLIRGVRGAKLTLRRPRIQWSRVRRILNIGLPIAGAGLLRNTARIAYVSVVGLSALGVTLQAAVGVGLQIRLIAILPALGFQIAISTLVGDAIGRGELGEAEAIGRRGVAILGSVMAVLCLCIIVFARPIATVFIADPGAIPTAVLVLRWFAVGQFFSAVSIGVQGILSGAGDTRPVMRYTVVSQWFVLFGFGFVLLRIGGLDPEGILISWAVAPVLMVTLLYRRFRTGIWKTVKV